MSIHKVDNGYVIGSRGVWLPGCYESERAARFAFRLPDAALVELRDAAIQRGTFITWTDISAKSAELRKKKNNKDTNA